jgi:hypothetical protein
MSDHCRSDLSYPKQGHLPNIDIAAEVKPCYLKSGASSTQTTIVDNQRTGNIYKLHVGVRPKFNGVILNGNPTITEYTYDAPVLRSGKQITDKLCKMTVNPNKPINGDEIVTAVVLYDSTQVNGTNYGTPESALIEYTIDLN